MSKIEVEFAFELGDLVYIRGADHDHSHRPKKFVVYERIAQECHGGVQRLYRLSGVSEHIAEIVLTKECPPYTRRCDECCAERRDMLKQDHEAADRVLMDEVLEQLKARKNAK